jgi:antigen flippase
VRGGSSTILLLNLELDVHPLSVSLLEMAVLLFEDLQRCSSLEEPVRSSSAKATRTSRWPSLSHDTNKPATTNLRNQGSQMLKVASTRETCVQTTDNKVAGLNEKGTHGQILKSSAMVGGSQLLNIVIGMVRTKAMALLLGPSGFGLFGLFGSVLSLAQTLAGLGVNSSGVRQIAAAVSSGDQKTITETVLVLRRVSIVLGVFGAASVAIFSRQISILTFASDRYTSSVAWLSIAVFLSLVSASQTALIQGMRRIADLAKLQILGALFSALFGIPLVYFFRDRGVVPSLVCVAVMTIFTSWWFERRVTVSTDIANAMTAKQIRKEAGSLLKLGLAFMTSALITLGSAYAVRVTIQHQMGPEATGLYQSAWSLGGLYVGFILQAMGADFYPRLTASANDDATCNRLVNEQAQVGILLAAPGVIATLTFAPLVIALFYSAKFGPAVIILRWICLATILQVISWPLGYVIVAKAKQKLFVACEVAWGIVGIAMAWLCISHFGLAGAGIAYFGSYVFHGVMVYMVVARMSGFRWSKENWTIGLVSLFLVTIIFLGFYVLPLVYGVALGAAATLFSVYYSMRRLTSFLSQEQVPQPIRKLLVAFGLFPRSTPGLAGAS